MAEPEHLELAESYPYIFEGHAPGRTRARPNKGELTFEEKHPADPLKDPITREYSHRGGEASPRTELY
ncbi:MAG TPA: hypothetical protein V6D47_16810 [Oscillatoriaceae cyanobacterium]